VPLVIRVPKDAVMAVEPERALLAQFRSSLERERGRRLDEEDMKLPLGQVRLITFI
jgi:hypothetical protein